MNRSSIMFLTLVLAGFGLLLAWLPAQSASPHQSLLPPEGWVICDVGDLEPVDAVGEPRQVFRVCRADGWEVKAYCTQPGIEPPAVNTGCSLLDGEIFWCGDMVQELAVLAIIQTPPPTATPTNTATILPTETPTQTSTAAPTATEVPETLQSTSTPPAAVFTLVPTAAVQDVRVRPAPGGPGNVVFIFLALFGMAVAWGVGVWVLFLRRRSER